MKKQELIEMLSRALEEARNLPDDAKIRLEESNVSSDDEYSEEYYTYHDCYDIYIYDMTHICGYYTIRFS